MIGESWITTQFETIEEWAQRNSFWPLPFGTACCAIEFMSTVSSHYDAARFGYEVVRASDQELLATATIELACVDLKARERKVVPLPEGLRQMMEPMVAG